MKKNVLNYNNKEEIKENLLNENIIIKKYIANITYVCKKGGNNFKQKINQDNLFISEQFQGSKKDYFFGICDGHGKYGKYISSYIVTNLPNSIIKNFKENKIDLQNTKFSTIKNLIIKIFIDINELLIQDKSINTKLSGTTCTCLIYTPDKIITFNLGDSRIILGKKQNDKYISEDLTIDHKPTIPDERERILNSNGIIEPYKDINGNFSGPYRVWTKKNENIPGLAMSRSFGDEIAHSVGVSEKPDVFQFNYKLEDKFIVMGSDGLWEFVDSQECVELVKNFYENYDIKGAIKKLYLTAKNRWIDKEGAIDDITIIIIFLN